MPRTYANLRVFNYQPQAGMRGLGNISDIVSQLGSYSSGQILDAYNALYQAYQSEQQDLQQMQLWMTGGNLQGLTPDGQQLYIQAVNEKTEVVNGLQDQVSKYASVLQALGIGSNLAPGLTGLTGYGYLGEITIITGVILAILIIVIGAGTWEYFKSKSDEALAKAAQAKQMTQVQSNVPQLMQQCQASGVAYDQCWQRVQAYVNQAQKSTEEPWYKNIPWTAGLLVVGGVLGLKTIFD